mmetsp:Transcript_10878/g.67190  ORF Transcript_10878/g.67190 Transcript_10878/m.67190 type:complete len:286 (+) Transcript_10878:482-1339(+)
MEHPPTWTDSLPSWNCSCDAWTSNTCHEGSRKPPKEVDSASETGSQRTSDDVTKSRWTDPTCWCTETKRTKMRTCSVAKKTRSTWRNGSQAHQDHPSNGRCKDTTHTHSPKSWDVHVRCIGFASVDLQAWKATRHWNVKRTTPRFETVPQPRRRLRSWKSLSRNARTKLEPGRRTSCRTWKRFVPSDRCALPCINCTRTKPSNKPCVGRTCAKPWRKWPTILVPSSVGAIILTPWLHSTSCGSCRSCDGKQMLAKWPWTSSLSCQVEKTPRDLPTKKQRKIFVVR